MRSLCMLLVGWLVLAVAVGHAQDKKAKIDKAKLVGTWTFVKTDAKEGPPPGATFKVTFTNDGKATQTMTLKDKKFEAKGTFKLEGSTLTLTYTPPGAKKPVTDVLTIKELTDKKLVTTEKKKGKVETTEFKK